MAIQKIGTTPSTNFFATSNSGSLTTQAAPGMFPGLQAPVAPITPILGNSQRTSFGNGSPLDPSVCQQFAQNAGVGLGSNASSRYVDGAGYCSTIGIG